MRTVLGDLTPMGRILANLATDPQLGKMMILGCVFSCLDPILTVVAALEYKSPFFITKVGLRASLYHNFLIMT